MTRTRRLADGARSAMPSVGSSSVGGRAARTLAERLFGRLPVSARIWGLTVLLAGTAGIIYVLAVRGHPGPIVDVDIPWPLLAFAVAVAELRVVDVHFRRETHSFSLERVPGRRGHLLPEPG